MRKKLAAILLCGLMCFGMTVHALEMPKTNSYTYSDMLGYPQPLTGPMPYTATRVVNFSGENAPQSPVDMVFDPQGESLYVVDNQQEIIFIYDKNLNYKDSLRGFTKEGAEETFSEPSGLYLDEDGNIYICDTGNGRIVVLDKNRQFVREYRSPQSAMLGENYAFHPLKVTVDSFGNMYIINRNEFNGLFQMDKDGNFVNFIGSNKVVVNPIELFWKKIMTSDQREQMLQFTPIEFTNLSKDDKGFIYVVSSSLTEETPIKRLNLSGTDVLKRTGYVDVRGDFAWLTSSSFCDITSDENDTYYALDSQLGRIFVYNYDGYLLYAFGGLGNTLGTFSSPIAIERYEENLYVLDNAGNSVTMFEQNEYGKLVSSADNAYRHGRYDESKALWEKVLELNSNYELAYAQLGSVLLEKGEIEESMEYFLLGNYRGDEISQLDGYNKAFTEYRKQFSQKYMGYIILLVIILAVVVPIVISIIRKKRRG